MAINFNPETKIFHLTSLNFSYIFQIYQSGHLIHLYWGKKIQPGDSDFHLLWQEKPNNPIGLEQADLNKSLDIIPQEYPAYGNTDTRSPAYQFQLENGSTITDLTYKTHRIYPGKPKLKGLPATYIEKDTEADTLEIELQDPLTGLIVVLIYTVFNNFNVITRSVRFKNQGKTELKILRALSANVDFHDWQYDLIHLSGSWARERHIHKRPLYPGLQAIESSRGFSSHVQNPFIALLRKGANEHQGEVYGFNLVYSGNFLALAEVGPMDITRVAIGINPFDFTWILKPGEDFHTPEAVMVYSDQGLNGMSAQFHTLYRSRLCRGRHRDQERPVLINNWEATYFNFNEEKLIAIAKTAADLGIELFVLDDGWFGKRNSDNCSLGDWIENRQKLPNGLKGLSEKIEKLGLKFGLWVEPEMVSPDSDLYRLHPDWCLHVPDRSRSLGRNQLILDLSRTDVCEAIIKMMSDILKSARISYIKWDFNRGMTEIGSALLPPERQRETAHRYMLGLYRILEIMTTTFPHVLFESCAGGGGRFDPGMLYYMPQTWTSDDTDAVERLKIQYGTSLVYPPISMGAHVSAVPNHQIQRITPLEMRGHTAVSANFGYELDLTKLNPEEMTAVRDQIVFYKQNRQLIQFGNFYRLLSPFENNHTAWMFVAPDQKSCLVFYFQVLAQPFPGLKIFKLQGISPDLDYRLESTGELYSGSELLYAGLNIPRLKGDYQSCVWKFTAMK